MRMEMKIGMGVVVDPVPFEKMETDLTLMRLN